MTTAPDTDLSHAEPAPPAPPGWRQALGALRGRSPADYAVLLVLVVMIVLLSIGSDSFLTVGNLLNIVDQWAPVGIIACAGTLVIIAGGFDLSVGAVFALGGVVAAQVAQFAPAPFAFAAGIVAGAVAGLVNGVLATTARINAFIVTLASSIIVRGVALFVTGGLLVSVPRSGGGFGLLGTGSVFGISVASWLFLIVVVGCAFLLGRMPFGRHVHAAGGNAEAARLSGVRVDAVRTVTFVLSGLAAGLAGVIAASQVSNAQADAGTGLELQAIAAIVIVGTSIIGGEGAIWRTVVGLFILALINNGLTLLGIDANLQLIIQGLVILLAVAVDVWGRSRAGSWRPPWRRGATA